MGSLPQFLLLRVTLFSQLLYLATFKKKKKNSNDFGLLFSRFESRLLFCFLFFFSSYLIVISVIKIEQPLD